MANDAKVEVGLKVDYDGRRDMAAFNRDMKQALRTAARTQAGLNAIGASNRGLNGMKRWRRSFDQVDAAVKMLGTVGLKGLSLALKGATLSMAAMGAAMLAVHASFVAGNAIMKGFRATLGPIAAGMAGVTAALATASAAIREQQAAMYAYKTTSQKEFGSGLNQTRQVMATLQRDTYLASAGVENLNKAFAAVSKTSTFTAGSQNLLKGLMDFASAGQPIEQGIEKAGELIAALQDKRISWSKTKVAAEALFPDQEAMKKAFTKLGIDTKKELESAIKSGTLGKALNVTGQWDAVSGTLINRLKGYMNIIRSQFADLGQPLLEPVKMAAYDIFKILQKGFVRISHTTKQFGMGNMLEGIVGAVDKMVNWATTTIQGNIENVEGMFERMSDWWGRFRQGWDETLDKLRPFIKGARVIESAFGAAWKHVKSIVSSKFGDFNDWLVNNSDTVKQFGDNMGALVRALLDMVSAFGDLQRQALPFINKILDGMKQLVGYTTGLLETFSKMFGGSGAGAFSVLMGMKVLFGQMAGTKGGFMRNLPMNNMTVQSRNVTVINSGMGTTAAAALGLAPRSLTPVGGVSRPTGGGGGLASSGPGAFAVAQSGLTEAARVATYMKGLQTTTPTPPTPPAGAGVVMTPYGPVAIPGAGGPPTPPTPPTPPAGGGGAPPGGGRFSRFRSASRSFFFSPDMRTADQFRDTRMFANAKSRMRSMRSETAFAKMMFGDEKRGQKGFNKSAGGQMATMMALSIAAQNASPEAQGALALGSMVGAYNPVMGLGIAGLGTAMSAKTVKGGVLSGAAGGAALGSFAGAPGMIVGAIAGAVIGGFKASLNAAKERAKKSRAVAERATKEIVDMSLSGMFFQLQKGFDLSTASGRKAFRGPTALRNSFTASNDAFKSILNTQIRTQSATSYAKTVSLEDLNTNAIGSYTDIQNAADAVLNAQKGIGATITLQDRKDVAKDPTAYIKKVQKDSIETMDASGKLQEMFNGRMDLLGKVTGKNDNELVKLAETMGVNLFDSTKSFNEIMKELGLTVLKTSDQFKAATTNIAADNLSIFDQALKRLETPQVLDEQAKAYRQLYSSKGGQLDETDRVGFAKQMMEGNIALYGSGAMALAQFEKSFKEGTAYKGGPLKGLKGTSADLMKSEAVKAYLDQTKRGIGQEALTQLQTSLGAGYTVNGDEFMKRVLSMTPEQLVQLEKVAAGGFALPTGSAGARMVEEYGSSQKAKLAAAGLSGLSLEYNADAEKKVDDLATAANEIGEKTTELISKMDEVFKKYKDDRPEWMTTKFIKKIAEEADTSTPRGSRIGDTTSSRLSQTMGRHAAMDSMLTGKRIVQSSYRTWGLGSINSDHVTGRAYDLTGQNLGQYQRLVSAGGGFAEFHGTNGSRHLHVVPGPGIYGDSMTPALVKTPQAAMVASGSGGSSEYNFYITGGQNASPKQIADEVMMRIKSIERSNRERA